MNRRTLAPLATALSLAGCFGEPPADDVGSAVAEVQSVPAGVGCLRFVYRAPNATADATRNFAVTPGAPATLDLGYLAAGAYAFRASAYNAACSAVAAATVPTWVGDPAAATVAPGLATTVPITLRPNVTTRTTVDFVQPVRAIYSGPRSANTYAVMQDGTVRAWGINDNGQVGDGSTALATTPRTVTGLTSPLQISASREFVCATTPNSGLHCWGYLASDQLADGGGTRLALVPQRNADFEPETVAAGRDNLCGSFAGRVLCWGRALPDGLSRPGVAATSYGLGADSWLDGGAFYWIDPESLRLQRSAPDAPSFSSPVLRGRVTAVVVSEDAYCALTGGGGVVCAGGGYADGGGSSTPAPLDAPVDVGVEHAVALTAGLSHRCALRDDRTVVCWGSNGVGQVGAGLDAEHTLHPAVVPLANVQQIAAGLLHTCALLGDGSVWCWGHNGYGQLGDGTTTSRFTPVRVRF